MLLIQGASGFNLISGHCSTTFWVCPLFFIKAKETSRKRRQTLRLMFHSTFALLLIIPLLGPNVAWTCSVPNDLKIAPYTPSERAVLAPIVLEAQVLNTTAPSNGPVFSSYKACVLVEKRFKSADVEVPHEFCFGSFGPDELCLFHVFAGARYVFFLSQDLTARYDGIVPVPALPSSDEAIATVKQGICEGDDCVLPRIDESFKHSIFVVEGKNTAVPCKASGTAPLVVTWTRRGHQTSQRGSSLSLDDVTFKDRGVYTCTVRNPAGKVQGKTVVFIIPVPCGKVVALGNNETTTIESPSFPDLYPRSKMCSWRVCPPTGKRLEFSFTKFDLRRFDKLDIDNECDLDVNPWRTYCGSVSPGKVVSRCPSGCVTLGMSSSDGANQVAKGFQAFVTTTDKEGAPFDMLKLFCDSDVVLKVKPKGHLLYSQFNAQVLVNYKPGLPVIGDNVTIYNSGFLGSNNLFGCLENVEHGKDYYVFASREGEEPLERFVSKFVATNGSRKNPPNFEEKLNSYKTSSPQCS